MRRNPVTEVAYQVIDSRHRIVNKRKIFKTEAAMRKYFDKLEKDGHLHQILGYRKNPILEILGTAAATGVGFGAGMKLLDKISEKWGKKKNPTGFNPLVSVPVCSKCGRKRGEKHKATTKAPSIKTMERWTSDGVARATDGCRVEPDGICQHGHMSWIMRLGYINPIYTKSGRLVVFPELLTTMRTWVNPKVRAEALEARKRYSDDLKAGHKDAAEYWKGQAGAYFTANPGAEWHRRRADELRNRSQRVDDSRMRRLMWNLENENKLAADASQRLGISNPRPPSQWWANTYPRVRASYPGASRERVSRITADIWWNLPEETRERIIRKYD